MNSTRWAAYRKRESQPKSAVTRAINAYKERGGKRAVTTKRRGFEHDADGHGHKLCAQRRRQRKQRRATRQAMRRS